MSEDDSFISKLQSSGSDYFSLLSELGGSEEDIDLDSGSDLSFVIRPSSEKVTEEAENIIRDRVDNAEDIPYDDPRPVIRAAESQMMKIRDDLVDEVQSIKKKERESVSGSDTDTMLYVIDDNAGKTGKFTILGGAESLIYNLADKQDWHPAERDLIYEANRIAAQKNNLQRHLLLDTVVIIPNDKEVL